MKVDTVLKWLPLGSIIAVIFTGGILYATIKSLLFDDVEQKVNIIQHEEKAPNDVDTYKLYRSLDSMAQSEIKNKKDAIRSRASRDNKLDSVIEMVQKMAVTQYQAKQYTDSINQYWKKYNATQDE